MQRPDMEALWADTPWGGLWAMALIVGAGALIAALLDGWTLGASIVVGLLAGPGWLAICACVGLISWACGGRNDHRY
jgi:hypothetical protein